MFPLHYHYEDVLRQDLLLKLNYENVLEVAGLFEIRLVPGAVSDFRIQFAKLAMEILCGQRLIKTQSGPDFQGGKSTQRKGNPYYFKGSKKDTGYVSDFARQSVILKVMGHGMYNFLFRILTVMSILDSPVEIRDKCIQFSMETEFCEFSPELEENFEIFESIRGFNVTICTSSKTKDETLLLWSGFLQKDEGDRRY